jgi:hypothetical protein
LGENNKTSKGISNTDNENKTNSERIERIGRIEEKNPDTNENFLFKNKYLIAGGILILTALLSYF